MKAAATTLQEMKTTQKCDEKEEQPAFDIAFLKQVEGVILACEELSQQVKINLLVQTETGNNPPHTHTHKSSELRHYLLR